MNMDRCREHIEYDAVYDGEVWHISTIESSHAPRWKNIYKGWHKAGGYVFRRVAYHPHANARGYCLEHRLVIEKHLGRILGRDEVVHHKNDIRDDNRYENLEVLASQSVHVTNHNKHKTRGVRNRFTSNDPHFETEKYRLYDKDSGITREYTLGQLINTSFRRGKFEYRGKSTGLKDSEGTLIYEGDVVEFLGGARGVIVWGEDDCVACFTVEYEEGGEKFRDYDYLEDKGLKVLGNIYEGDTKNAKRD